MGKSPTVAIIGRPNTGKSTLFNRLIGKRKAIVSEIPGTTRDKVVEPVEYEGSRFILMDTGGMGGGSADLDLETDVARQSELALETSDVILFTVNGKEQLTSSDFHITEILRKKKRQHVPVIIVITKCDHPDQHLERLNEYYSLGISDEIITVSAAHNIGIEELQNAIVEKFKLLHFPQDSRFQSPDSKIPRIALVGKANVGKSSILNALMSDPDREKFSRIVSAKPGTTRDTTDMTIRHDGKEYIFVDTAGLKQRKGLQGIIEYFSNLRSVQTISDADMTILVIDASIPLTRQDKRIAGLAVEEGKGLVLLANKIDLLKKESQEQAFAHIRSNLPFCQFAPLIPVSSETREGLLKVFPCIDTVLQNRSLHIETRNLHRWFEQAIHGQPMQALSKSKFITQAEGIPPTFVLFVKNPRQVRPAELKYLENNLRKTFALEGTPVRWITKKD